VGVRSFKEAEYFLTRGAGEVYCGVPQIPNHGIKAENFSGKDEIFKTIDLAKKLGKRALIVANDVFPDKDFKPGIKLLREFVEYGAYGIIIRDLALLDHFKKNGIKTHIALSTLSLCFNSSAIKFFMDRGVRRMVLPQHMSPREAEPIFRLQPELEIEIFCLPIFYETNLNCMCSLFCPCGQEIIPGKAPIPFTCHSELESSLGGKFTMPMPDNVWLLKAFYDFYNMGANYVKAARGPNIEEVIELFHKTVYLTKLLEKGISKELFVIEGERAIQNSQNYGKNYIYNPLTV